MTPSTRFLIYLLLTSVIAVILIYTGHAELFYIYTAVSAVFLTQRLIDLIK